MAHVARIVPFRRSFTSYVALIVDGDSNPFEMA
jgi:hypothetical protein